MTALTTSLQGIAMPVGRVLLSFIFIMAGFSKITGYAGTVGYMESRGVPGGLLPLVILVEFGGGLMILLGYKARLAAFLLGGFSVLSGILFHLIPSFGMDPGAAQGEMIGFMKNFAIAGGMAYVFANGAGAWSLDGHAKA